MTSAETRRLAANTERVARAAAAALAIVTISVSGCAGQGDATGNGVARVDSGARGDVMDATAGDSSHGGATGGDSGRADGGADATAGDAAETGDGGDSGCAPPPGPVFACYFGPSCNGASQYCLFGSVANACRPLPAECQCAETHDCACLLASVRQCDGGATLTCTADQDGGALFVAVYDNNGSCP